MYEPPLLGLNEAWCKCYAHPAKENIESEQPESEEQDGMSILTAVLISNNKSSICDTYDVVDLTLG